MNIRQVLAAILAIGFAGGVQAEADLSGTWELNGKKGENLGMMAALKETLVMTQTVEHLTLDYTDVFRGNTSTRQVVLNLTGTVVDNVAAMGAKSKTESDWDGDTLVTIWRTESAIPGNEVVRTETYVLSADGSELTLTSERVNSPTLIMVYEKQ